MKSRALIRKALVPQALHIVPYLTREEVGRLVTTCQGRNRLRDELLILTLFQTGLRISEALSLTPRHIGAQEGGPVLYVLGKGGKARLVACPDTLAHRLKSFAFDRKLRLEDRIFKINRKRAWQIIKEAAERAGINKKVHPHLLHHSDAIERLRQTGNPRALQIHLGHASPFMTLRYVFQYERHFPHGAKIALFSPQKEDLPFNRYFADWLEGKVIKETTRRNWESAFWKHLYPFFKNRLISTITRADIGRFQRTMVDKGLNPSTINDKTMKLPRMLFHQAFVDEVIPKNPTLGVKRLAQGMTDVDPFTIEEREAIINGVRRYAPL